MHACSSSGREKKGQHFHCNISSSRQQLASSQIGASVSWGSPLGADALPALLRCCNPKPRSPGFHPTSRTGHLLLVKWPLVWLHKPTPSSPTTYILIDGIPSFSICNFEVYLAILFSTILSKTKHSNQNYRQTLKIPALRRLRAASLQHHTTYACRSNEAAIIQHTIWRTSTRR